MFIGDFLIEFHDGILIVKSKVFPSEDKINQLVEYLITEGFLPARSYRIKVMKLTPFDKIQLTLRKFLLD